MSDQTDDDLDAVRPFHDWLADQARGLANEEATAGLQEVVQAVAHLGRKGKVTIEVIVEPGNNAGTMIKTSVVITAKPPVPVAEESIFYVNTNGSLVRDDPYQRRLPLRTIDPDTAEIIDLGANPDQENQ